MDLDKMMAEANGESTDAPKVEENQENKEQVVESQETAPVENKEDVPTNTEQPSTETPEDTKVDFDIESFNKAIGREVKDISEISALFEQKDEYEKAKALLEEKESLISEKDKALSEKFDVLKYFANENEFKVNQILKSNNELNKDVVRKLVYSNVDELGDKDVLILNEVLAADGVYDESIIKRIVDKKYGLDVNKEDLDGEELKDYQAQEFLMKKDAITARRELKKLLDIEMPEMVNPIAEKEQKEAEFKQQYEAKKSDWESFTNKFVKDSDSFNIEFELDNKEKANFEVKMTDDFKQALIKNLPEKAARSGLDINNPEHVNQIVDLAKKDYLYLKQGAIFKAFREDIVSKMTEDTEKKFYNPTKPKQVEPPKQLSTEEEAHNKKEMERFANEMGIKI